MSCGLPFVAACTALGLSVWVPQAVNVSAPVPRGNMPLRIHVIEDYETDIEKRWWLRGELETKNVPPRSTRACRGKPSKDFDDKMGNAAAMYTAVVFNPVPGPPMGKQTRLSFRYWLKGSGALRVQIYSLSKNYHRCLTLVNLPQEKWGTAAVDMTQARRPDGSGGPLGQDERIDDIQFYADPAAELIIDDIILYDAAPEGEQLPFPKRPIFTAWFDTGKQGKEWPGSFEIVSKAKDAPPLAKAARSVPREGSNWIRVELRGERTLGETTHLRFRYFLTGTKELRVALTHSAAKRSHSFDLKDMKPGEWGQITIACSALPIAVETPLSPLRKGDRIDGVEFLLSKAGEVLIDDLLLYEPGVNQP